MAGLFLLVSALILLMLPLALAQSPVAQEELQIAIRRYMQCQADNVGTYNTQVQLFQIEIGQLRAELDKAKKQLAELKSKSTNADSNVE